MPEAIRILCAVRDRRSMLPVMGELEDGERCVFEVVTTGKQAIAACLRAVPDILVIDAVLPSMDGLGVVDRLSQLLAGQMPAVIGGARTAFARSGFMRRGACAVVSMPWRADSLKSALLMEMNRRESYVDWNALLPAKNRAGEFLIQMGMRESLKGFDYLSSAAALAYAGESRLFSIGKELYVPLAAHHRTTVQNVERLIRHAIESTMNAARAKGVYSLFGNTIDPAKGKPTNAQVIAMLVQRMRVEKRKQSEKACGRQITKTAILADELPR